MDSRSPTSPTAARTTGTSSLDAAAGELLLGPGRAAGGRHAPPVRRRAAQGRPPRDPTYCTGGGRQGNVAARAISVLEVVDPVRRPRREPAAGRGGVDGEDIENAKVRGPILLRTRGRAVTTEDYEQLAREAAPEVARVRAVAAGDGADAGSVRVLVVPAAAQPGGPAAVRAARALPTTLSRRSPTASTSAG